MSTDVPHGYLPPDDAYSRAAEFTIENDPLVNDARNGISGWFNRVSGVITRSGKTLLPLFALTVFVPTLLAGVVGGLGISMRPKKMTVAHLASVRADPTDPAASAPSLMEMLAVVAAVAAFLSLIAAVLQFVAYGGASYIAVRQAAGLTVRWTEGLRYGFRRCLGLLGWYILTGLAVGIPFMLVFFCLASAVSFLAIFLAIPAVLYIALATAMVGPAYVFERRNPLGRTFGLFHGAPGRMTGRLLLTGLAYAIPSGVGQVLGMVADALPESVPLVATLGVTGVIVAAVQAVGLMIVFAGVLVTYAECRGDEGSLTPDLLNEL